MPALINLTATNRLTGSVCFARQTEPMPPSPITSTRVYLLAMTVPDCSSLPAGSAVGPAAGASGANGLNAFAGPGSSRGEASLARNKASTRARSSVSSLHARSR